MRTYQVKDVRNLMFPRECIILSYPYDKCRELMLYLQDMCNIQGFVFLSDLLSYIDRDDSFEVAGEYGWNEEMIDEANKKFMYNVFKKAYDTYFDYPTDDTYFAIILPKPISALDYSEELDKKEETMYAK